MGRSRDGEKKGGNGEGGDDDENSGHYVIASSRPPERRPLERRTLVPKVDLREWDYAPPLPQL